MVAIDPLVRHFVPQSAAFVGELFVVLLEVLLVTEVLGSGFLY